MRGIQFAVPVLAALLLVGGCSKDESTSPGSTAPGTLKLSLTDAPARFDHVNITFSEVAVNTQTDTTKDGWVVIKGEPQTLDLMALSNGLTAALGEKALEPGRYGQIRLKVTRAEVVVDGDTYPLDVPSGAASGLKLGGGFSIEPGFTTELVVDFDAGRSIHVMGKKGEYKLMPRLRLIARAVTGAVTGQVSNPQAAPVAYAISGADTVATAFVQADTGNFVLSFLPAGTYAVSLADTLGQTYATSGVAVNAGNSTNLGAITLEGVKVVKGF
jgi:hypothetical protein